MEGKLFSGKRDARRVARFLPVCVTGHGGTFDGAVVDISESGILLHVSGPGLDPDDPLVPFSVQVHTHLGTRVTLQLRDVQRTATVIRVTSWGAGVEGRHLVACRFERRLSAEECTSLGVELGADEPPEE